MTDPAPSPLRDHLLDLVRFDRWANRAVTDAAALAPESEDRSEVVRLFAHLTRAAEIWAGRVGGTDAAALPVWPDGPDAALAASAGRAERAADAWAEIVGAASDADLARPVRYRTSAGRPFETPLAEIAAHVSHHGAHHRGQIVRLLRGAGAVPPALDYVAYVRSRGSQPSEAVAPSESPVLPRSPSHP